MPPLPQEAAGLLWLAGGEGGGSLPLRTNDQKTFINNFIISFIRVLVQTKPKNIETSLQQELPSGNYDLELYPLQKKNTTPKAQVLDIDTMDK